MGYQGQEVHGVLHSTDASSGVEIVLYDSGTGEVVDVGPRDHLDIHAVQLVTAPGGDCYILVGPDATLGSDAGQTVVRGTFAANGGVFNELRPHYAGIRGGKPYVVAPSGVVDVVLKATLRKA